MLNDLETVPFVGRTTAKNVRISKKIANSINESLAIENMNFNSKLGYDLRLIPEIAKKPSYYCDKDEVIYVQYNTKTKFIIPSIYVNENRQNVFFKNSFKKIISESSYDFSQDNITNINKGSFKKIDKDLYDISNISNLAEAYQFIEKNRLDESFSETIGKILDRVKTKAKNKIGERTEGQEESSKNWSLIKTSEKDGEVYNALGAANHLKAYIMESIPKSLHGSIGKDEFAAYVTGFSELKKGNINTLIDEIQKIENKATDTPDADEVVKVFIQYYEKKVGMLDEFKSVSDENIKKAISFAYKKVNEFKEQGFTEQNITKKIQDMSDIVDQVEKDNLDPKDSKSIDLQKSIEAAIEDMNRNQSEWVKKLRKLSGKAVIVRKAFTFIFTGLFRIFKSLKGGLAINFAAKGLATALIGADNNFQNNLLSGIAKVVPVLISFAKSLVLVPFNLLSWCFGGLDSAVQILPGGEQYLIKQKAIDSLITNPLYDNPAQIPSFRVEERMDSIGKETASGAAEMFQDLITADPSRIIDAVLTPDLTSNPLVATACFITTGFLLFYYHKQMFESLRQYAKIYLDFFEAAKDVFSVVSSILGRKGKTKNLRRVYIEQVKSLEAFAKSGIKNADKAVKSDLSSASFENFVRLIITNDSFGIDTKLSKSLVLKAAISSLTEQKEYLQEKDGKRVTSLENELKSKKEELESFKKSIPGGQSGLPNLSYLSGDSKKQFKKLSDELEELEEKKENILKSGKYINITEAYDSVIKKLNTLISDQASDIEEDVNNSTQNIGRAQEFIST